LVTVTVIFFFLPLEIFSSYRNFFTVFPVFSLMQEGVYFSTAETKAILVEKYRWSEHAATAKARIKEISNIVSNPSLRLRKNNHIDVVMNL